MPRYAATTDAAINGVVGLVLLSVGSAVAPLIFTSFDPWMSALPAFLVWCVFAYYAMNQFAHGIYTVVEEATEATNRHSTK
ncbi:hypothetical protein [Halopelagius fulvigenes]|uniref:Uncharacterized protein n=1 Tax=Halopelagius fulvigenes TaxID=1198324 RepID=A0ABD5TTT7_9EURY